MTKYLTLLLLIGLAFWSCTIGIDEGQGQGSDLPYINCSYLEIRSSSSDWMDCYTLDNTDSCYTENNLVYIHYYKDDNYFVYSGGSFTYAENIDTSNNHYVYSYIER